MTRALLILALLTACTPQAAPLAPRLLAPSCHETGMEPPTMKCLRPGKDVIWGDSIAWGWAPAVVNTHGDVVQITRDSCGPLLDMAGEFPAHRKCRVFAAMASEAVQAFDTVYLAAKWKSYPATIDRTLAVVAPKVRQVVVIGPSPEMRPGGLSRAAFDAEAAPILAAMREAAKDYSNVTVIDVTDRFCTATECPPVLRGVPLYTDGYHLARGATDGQRLD